MTDSKVKKSTSIVLEFADAIRLEVNDGVPSLYAKDTYADSQEQDPWNAVATGGDVFEILDELQAFLHAHAKTQGSRPVT